jgi:NAD(P)H dehydrogenase (quinone)
LGSDYKPLVNGALHNKPACVFTSSGSMHGGQESTLLTMLPPLFHHGMMILGLPNSIPALSNTKTGGTPYGASHVSGPRHDQSLSQDEKFYVKHKEALRRNRKKTSFLNLWQ